MNHYLPSICRGGKGCMLEIAREGKQYLARLYKEINISLDGGMKLLDWPFLSPCMREDWRVLAVDVVKMQARKHKLNKKEYIHACVLPVLQTTWTIKRRAAVCCLGSYLHTSSDARPNKIRRRGNIILFRINAAFRCASMMKETRICVIYIMYVFMYVRRCLRTKPLLVQPDKRRRVGKED